MPTRFEIRNTIFEVLSEHRDEIKQELGDQYTSFVTTPSLLTLAKMTADVHVDLDEMAETIRDALSTCHEHSRVWEFLDERINGLEGLLDESQDFDDALTEIEFVEQEEEFALEEEASEDEPVEDETALEPEVEPELEEFEEEEIELEFEEEEYEPALAAAVIDVEETTEEEAETVKPEPAEEDVSEIPEIYIPIASSVRAIEDEEQEVEDIPEVSDVSPLLKIRHAILDTVQGQRDVLERRMGANYNRLIMSPSLLSLARLSEEIDTPRVTKSVIDALTACKEYPPVWQMLERRIIGVDQLFDEGFTLDAAVQNIVVLDELPAEEYSSVRALDEGAGAMGEPDEVKQLQRGSFRQWGSPEEAVSRTPITQLKTTRGLSDEVVGEDISAAADYEPDLVAMRPNLSRGAGETITAPMPPAKEPSSVTEGSELQRQSTAVLQTILNNKGTIRTHLGDEEFRSFLVKAEIQNLIQILQQEPVDQAVLEEATYKTLDATREYPVVWNMLIRNVPEVSGLLEKRDTTRGIDEQLVKEEAPTPYTPAPIPKVETPKPTTPPQPAPKPIAPIEPAPREETPAVAPSPPPKPTVPVEKPKQVVEEKKEESEMAEQPRKSSIWERLTDKEFVTSFIGVIVIVSTTIIAIVTLIVAIVPNTTAAFQGAKDVLLLMNGMAGVVLGYYFGRAPGEARAQSAEKLSQEYQQQAQTATTKSNQVTQVLNSMVSEVENMFEVSGLSETRKQSEDPQAKRQKVKLENLVAQAKKYIGQ